MDKSKKDSRLAEEKRLFNEIFSLGSQYADYPMGIFEDYCGPDKDENMRNENQNEKVH